MATLAKTTTELRFEAIKPKIGARVLNTKEELLSGELTDSINDLPLLAAVGHPHVVNPDARLAAEAEARGWPVLRWKL